MISNLTVNAASIYSLIMSANFSLYSLMIVSALPTIIFLATCYLLPESPMWLVKKGHTGKASRSLLYLRGPKYNLTYELKELENLVQSQETSGIMEKFQELKSRTNIIPFITLSVMYMLQVFWKPSFVNHKKEKT